jgi:hypothetical protein
MCTRGLELYESKKIQDQWTMDRMVHQVAVLRLDRKQREARLNTLAKVAAATADTPSKQRQHSPYNEEHRIQELHRGDQDVLSRTSANLSRRAVLRARHQAQLDQSEVGNSQQPPKAAGYQHTAGIAHDNPHASLSCEYQSQAVITAKKLLLFNEQLVNAILQQRH